MGACCSQDGGGKKKRGKAGAPPVTMRPEPKPYDCVLPNYPSPNDRIKIWEKMLDDLPKYKSEHPTEFRQHLILGVPPALRLRAWQAAMRWGPSDADAVKATGEQRKYSYSQLLEKSTDWETQIRKDMGRTFPEHQLFKCDGKSSKYTNQDGAPISVGEHMLYRVLKAYVLSQNVGYLQGMNFIAAMFLLVTTGCDSTNVVPAIDEDKCERETFELLHRYMDAGGFGMEMTYKEGLHDLKDVITRLGTLIEQNVPDVYDNLLAQGVHPLLFATSFFLTAFLYNVPPHLKFQLWDVMLLSASPDPSKECVGEDFILRFTLSYIIEIQHELVEADFQGLVSRLKDWNIPGQIALARMCARGLDLTVPEFPRASREKSMHFSIRKEDGEPEEQQPEMSLNPAFAVSYDEDGRLVLSAEL